jgi:tRNA(fMet)-specific endonuclease VapC
VSAYRELGSLFEFFASFEIVPFDRSAADLFDSLQAAKVRIATRDLKIASISLAHMALLLTANRRDFEKVPGLRFENWLE